MWCAFKCRKCHMYSLLAPQMLSQNVCRFILWQYITYYLVQGGPYPQKLCSSHVPFVFRWKTGPKLEDQHRQRNSLVTGQLDETSDSHMPSSWIAENTLINSYQWHWHYYSSCSRHSSFPRPVSCMQSCKFPTTDVMSGARDAHETALCYWDAGWMWSP